MKRLLSYFFPQTLARASSRYNHDIIVRLIDGAPALVVNGVIQSGAGFTKIWHKVFSHFHLKKYTAIKDIAVIGVGGGDVLHLLRSEFPHAHITAVDIDKKIVDIGKKYFNLDQVVDINFVVQDAQDFVRMQKTYELIILDLYIGNDIPSFLTQRNFLEMVRKRLHKRGAVVVNFLKASEVATDGKFEWVVKTIFSSVSSFDIAYNRFFLLTNF